MERKEAHRYDFRRAVPIKAGILRFPRPSPSLFKNKGLLEKAGEYFVAEAKPELTLLVKVRVQKKTSKKLALRPAYKEVKFLWTWE